MTQERRKGSGTKYGLRQGGDPMKADFNTFILLIISVQLALSYVKQTRK